MKILLMFLIALTSILVPNNAYSQSSNSYTMTPALTLKSNSFKLLVGSERVEAFKQIQIEVLTTAAANGNDGEATKMGMRPTIKTDLKILMGEPTLITEGGFWIYNLKSTTSDCKVVFGFDRNAQVIFYTIKDCQ